MNLTSLRKLQSAAAKNNANYEAAVNRSIGLSRVSAVWRNTNQNNMTFIANKAARQDTTFWDEIYGKPATYGVVRKLV